MRNLLKTTTLVITISWLFACVSFGGCIDGSGNMKRETREVSDFSGINVSGSMDVYLTQGSTQSLVVEADDNLLDLIKTDVKGKELYIGSKKCFNSRKDLKVFITIPTLTSLTISGSSDAKGSDVFKCGDLSLRVSGSGSITLNLEAKDIEMSISGSGEISLKGTAEDMNIRISGSGDLNARDLESKDVTAIVSGSGDCQVTPKGDLNAIISGSGDVTYYGKPGSVDSSISGSGSVRHKSGF